MITKLTPEQTAQIPKYLKMGEDVGYRTTTINREEARKAISFLYTDILNKKVPDYIIFLDSPMACNLAINLIKNTKFGKKITSSQLRSQLDSQLDSQLRSQLRSQLGSQLDSQLRSQLGSQLGSQLDSQLGSQLDSQLYSQLDSQLRSQLDSQLDSQLRSQLRSQLGSQLDSQLRSQLGSQLGSQLDSQLGSQLDSQLYSQLDSQLRSQLGSQLDSQLDSQLRSQLGSQLDSQLQYTSTSTDNLYWTGYYTFYKYALEVLMPEKSSQFEKLQSVYKSLQNLHHTYMYDNIVFISDFPKTINLNDRKQLHNFNGPALEYRDGYALYAFNGVRLTGKEQYAKTTTFTKNDILKEENADIRREIIRKIGIEKAFEIMDAEVLDSSDNYQLLSIDLGDNKVRPFLKMKNPSMENTWHIEGVLPEIKTIEQAIIYRNSLEVYTPPIKLT